MDRACVLTRALGRMARVDRQSRSGSGARGPLRVTLRLAGTPERWISREATNKFGTTDQLLLLVCSKFQQAETDQILGWDPEREHTQAIMLPQMGSLSVSFSMFDSSLLVLGACSY